MRLSTDQFYFRSPEEMAQLFADVPEALRDTVEIAERCNVELKLGEFRFPSVEVPGGRDAGQPPAAARRRGARGAPRRRASTPARARAVRRAPGLRAGRHREDGLPELLPRGLRTSCTSPRRSGIPVGPGRGSAAGSLAAWALGITDLDPLAYGLLFERFLNPGRKSMPDIDVDFEQNRRDEVIAYVRQKYGEDRVAQIITFGTLQAKGVIRDVGRVLGMPLRRRRQDRQARPRRSSRSRIEKALEKEPRLAELAAKDPQVARLLEIAAVARGPQPPRLDPRLGGADLPRAAREPRAALQGHQRRDADAVRHGGHPEDRARQVRLPRPDHADRDPGRGAAHPAPAAARGEALQRPRTIPLDDPETFKHAREPARPPASSSSSPPGCATPSSRCARTSSTT